MTSSPNWPRLRDGVAGFLCASRVRWRDLRGALVVRRPAAQVPVADIAAFLTGVPDCAPARQSAAAELRLPSGTVLTAADHEALVTRFTAHAGVLIRAGMCPLHERLLVPCDSGETGGVCAVCARGWFAGPVTPYAVAGATVTGGMPLQPGDLGRVSRSAGDLPG